MRAGNGVSPHVKEQFIWNELSLRSSSRRETGTLFVSDRQVPVVGSALPDVRG